jgi:hypothetical protein
VYKRQDGRTLGTVHHEPSALLGAGFGTKFK